MKKKVIAVDEWLEHLKQAAQELNSTSLRFDARAKGEALGKSSEPRPGAYIAVLGESNSMHLGIAASPEGCRALTRGLLGVRSDEEISDHDAIDGMSEVMNIIAGKVKSRLSAQDHTLRLGMPIFVQEPIQVREGLERALAEVKIGPVACELMVYRMKKAA